MSKTFYATILNSKNNSLKFSIYFSIYSNICELFTFFFLIFRMRLFKLFKYQQNYFRCVLEMIKRKFTPEEDSKICELVDKYGPRNWELIAREIPGRNSRQCRDRYQNYLIPGFFNGQWTKEEDELLYIKINQMGHQWTKMMKFFPGRTANCIKNRWNYFVCKSKYDDMHEEGPVKHYDIINNVISYRPNEIPYLYSGQVVKNVNFQNYPNYAIQQVPVETELLKVNKGTQTNYGSLFGIKFLLI